MAFSDEKGNISASQAKIDFNLGLDITLKGVDEVIQQMHRISPALREGLEQVIAADADKLRDRARAMASGEVIQERTGKFVASIQSSFTSDDKGVFGSVYSDDPRDPLFEYGGTQEPRDILPNAAQALRFLGGSALLNVLSLGTVGMVYAAIVHRPAVEYPKHPVIHGAFDEMEPQIEKDIKNAPELIHMQGLRLTAV